MTLSVQFLTVGMMLASGLFIGVVFDAYRVVSGELRLPRWLIPPLDVVYWLAMTLWVFHSLYHSNAGELRLYVFLALFAGSVLYFLLFSRWCIRLIRRLIEVVKAVYRFVVRMVDLLVVRPVRFLFRCLVILYGFLAATAMFLFKIVLQLLYPIRVLFRWMFRKLSPYLVVPGWLGKAWTWLKQWLSRLGRWMRG